jgi:hypothetical protein
LRGIKSRAGVWATSSTVEPSGDLGTLKPQAAD